jgi:hypothetical protein
MHVNRISNIKTIDNTVNKEELLESSVLSFQAIFNIQHYIFPTTTDL